MSDWISVKDRMPEDDLPENSKKKIIKCLITVDNGVQKPYVDKAQRNLETRSYKKHHSCGDWVWSKKGPNITHWMPLPEPPEEANL